MLDLAASMRRAFAGASAPAAASSSASAEAEKRICFSMARWFIIEGVV
jgi:hypothetical protein